MRSLDEPILLFLHVPKTAGTTLSKLIYTNEMPRLPKRELKRRAWRTELVAYSADGIYHLDGGFETPVPPDDLAAVSELIDEPTVRIVQGHFAFGLHSLFSRSATYVTLLRDPVERLLSLYSHYFGYRGGLDGDVVRFASQPHVRNDQTRRLSGLDPLAEPAAALAQAKRNLETRFTFVGVAELFDESVLLLGRMLRWKFVTYLRYLVNTRRPAAEAVPSSVRDELDAANTLDRELYELARRLLLARVAEAGEAFQRELQAFREENRRYDERYRFYPVDLNTATVEQLLALPGVGRTLAERIVDFRGEHGRFESADELVGVRGIGRTVRTKIQGLVLP
jgi:competence ComEA-like helix-hairpin-helix protein